MNKSAFFNYTAAKMNLFALIACVVGLISTFFAKATAKISGEVVATEGIMNVYGMFMVVLFVMTAVVVFLKKDHTALVFAAINVVFCIFKLIQQVSQKESAFGIEVKGGVNFAFYLMVIAAIVALVMLLLPVLTKKNGSMQNYGM